MFSPAIVMLVLALAFLLYGMIVLVAMDGVVRVWLAAES